MKLCGLTGGVGMGKSTAAGFFLQLGARIVDTDALAHELVQPGQPALREIAQEFGSNFIAADGTLKRAEMASLVFADAAARRRLEAILHPRIRERWRNEVELWRSQDCAVAMVAIPLLFETGAEHEFDRIICVACSAAQQRERLRGRGWGHDQISGRIAAQMPVEQKMARSHFVLWAEGSLEAHRRQVAEVFRRLTEIEMT
ncbi:MAG TPA: dephospho-CoA kinase [Verrucomicrobiae bacterium]